MPPGSTKADIENWFTYHSPSQYQLPKYQVIREAGKLLALCILENTPAGPDQTAAVRKVREAVMTANQAIACEGSEGGTSSGASAGR